MNAGTGASARRANGAATRNSTTDTSTTASAIRCSRRPAGSVDRNTEWSSLKSGAIAWVLARDINSRARLPVPIATCDLRSQRLMLRWEIDRNRKNFEQSWNVSHQRHLMRLDGGATIAVRSLSPFGERVGVRGLPAYRETLTPHPTPLPSELGFTRVRHSKVAEVGYIRLRLGEGADRVRRGASRRPSPHAPVSRCAIRRPPRAGA